VPSLQVFVCFQVVMQANDERNVYAFLWSQTRINQLL
jgi:hypothetical protein